MIGAIAGDIIGSVYEYIFYKKKWLGEKPYQDFELFQPKSHFTDDTTMSLAIAAAILNNKDYGLSMHEYGNRYPEAGYGGRFKEWLKVPVAEIQPYSSFGNGSGMRVSAVAWAFDDIETILKEAEKTALPTHNHPEGVKGAQAVAMAVFMARNGKEKDLIKQVISTRFGYNLNQKLSDIRPTYTFDTTCQGSIPESICCFLESKDVEDAIRLAISLGGDTDTMASIAGVIAQAYYKKIPRNIYENCQKLIPHDLWNVLQNFEEKYKVEYILI